MAEERTLLELIAGRDSDAAAGFFDAHAPSVRRYCEELAAPERLDEATLSAFVDFLGRVAGAPPDADLEDLLRKATRSAAASRAEVTDAREPACNATPELLAARANGELLRGEKALDDHLKSCRACQRMAERIAQAEEGWGRPAAESPPESVRGAWLELMAEDTSATAGADEPEPAALRPAPGVESEPHSGTAQPRDSAELSAVYEQKARSSQPEPVTGPAPEPPEPPETHAAEPAPAASPPPTRPVIVRRRSGGLVGAARRLLSPERQDH